MIRTLLLTLLLTLGTPTLIPAHSFTDPLRSIMRITFEMPDGQTGICTAFMVSASHAYFLTAAHCIYPDTQIMVDGEPATVVKTSNAFALLEVPAFRMERTPLDIESKHLQAGEPVTSYGYGYGVMRIFQRHVSNYEDGDMIMDGALVGGMSGGPVLNTAGKVVGLNQATAEGGAMSLACGGEEIRAFLKR